MWEMEVICDVCHNTHLVCSKLNPRAFAFECPVRRERVDMRYRDPSRISRPWAEVGECSPEAIPVLSAEERGAFEL